MSAAERSRVLRWPEIKKMYSTLFDVTRTYGIAGVKRNGLLRGLQLCHSQIFEARNVHTDVVQSLSPKHKMNMIRGYNHQLYILCHCQ